MHCGDRSACDPTRQGRCWGSRTVCATWWWRSWPLPIGACGSGTVT